MQNDQKLTTTYLLPSAAALVLVAAMGCEPGGTGYEASGSGSDPASAEGAEQNTNPDRASDGAARRDHSVAEISDESAHNAQYSLVQSATAEVGATSAGNAEGTVTFSAAEDGRGMRVNVELQGLQPGRLHGLHVHEVGDCSASDASSAGGHFSPYDSEHGSPEDAEQHVGDMGNIEADEDGRVSSEFRVRGLAFSGPASILQKAVIVHSKEDDLTSQPAGDAGNPAGCGVIRIDRQVLTD